MKPGAKTPASEDGTIIGAHGRHYVVRSDAGKRVVCFTRGKKNEAACGDRVRVERTGTDQGVIVEILPRSNLVYRSDAFKKKMLAANLTQMVVVLASDPSFSEELLGRALVTAETLGIAALIILNKTDLHDLTAAARERLRLYTDLKYPVLEISVRTQPEAARALLLPLLSGQVNLLLGQSGMGKSSLLNLLVPDAEAATREISQALHSGKHTTTFTRQYELRDAEQAKVVGALIDTPGFQEFGLAHFTPGQIERAFPELHELLGNCRFYNCTHLAEPGCAVRMAADQGQIAPRRFELFTALTRESTTPP